MSQAPAPTLAGPPPAARPSKLKLLIVPLGVLVLLAIPGGAFAYAQNELGQAQQLEAQGQFANALAAYQTVQSVAGNPASKILMGELSDKAQTGAAQTHFEWGQSLEKQAAFADAEGQFDAAVSSGVADWQTQGNQALAELFLAWGASLVKGSKFSDAIDKYRQVANYDPAGTLKVQSAAALATAYSGYAASFALQTPPDYTEALTWYQNLVKEFPDSPEAKLAQATALPRTLFLAANAFIGQSRFDQARDAMRQIIGTYPTTTWAAQARAAMAAPQRLTGKLIVSDANPVGVPNRLLRISTKWLIVAPHTYDDAGGLHLTTVTDGNGNFSLMVPPGQNYLVTWWDPGLHNFVTTFINDTVPVNQINIDPLQPAHANVAIS